MVEAHRIRLANFPGKEPLPSDPGGVDGGGRRGPLRIRLASDFPGKEPLPSDPGGVDGGGR